MKLTHFDRVINVLARDLPQGYDVSISVERHGGAVLLEGPDGENIDYPSNHETVMESVEDALAHARELAGLPASCCFMEDRNINGGCNSCGAPCL
jgi:hypothetical protein